MVSRYIQVVLRLVLVQFLVGMHVQVPGTTLQVYDTWYNVCKYFVFFWFLERFTSGGDDVMASFEQKAFTWRTCVRAIKY